MVLRRFSSILALSLALSLSASAQESTSFVRRVFDRVLEPSRELDPEAVYQPAPRWHLALTGDLRRASVSQDHEFSIASMTVDGDGNERYDYTPARLSTVMQGGVDKGVGFQGGIGNLSLSLSKKFREKGSGNQTLSLDLMAAGYALQVQYFRLSQPVRYKLTMELDGNPEYATMSGETDDPGRMRALTLDAFYAFNRRTFAYSAAYKGSVIQRRSAGSVMFGSKLTLGEFMLDPSESITTAVGGQNRQTSAQVSVGGGYSYNLVPYHRQPYGDREEGLRNFTVNFTFLPMVTMFNQFTSTSYKPSESGEYLPARKEVMNGRLMVNYVARIGAGYTRNLNTFNLSASYDSYSYDGSTVISLADMDYKTVKTSGGFRRWIVSLRLCRRF